MFTFATMLLLGFGEHRLKDLESNIYATREKAHKKIATEINFELYLWLKARKISDTEAQRRIEVVLENYEEGMAYETYQKIKDLKELSEVKTRYEKKMVAKWMPSSPKDYPAYPWIDRLPHGYQWNGWNGYRLNQFYLCEAQKRVGVGCSPYWNDHRAATHMWVFDRVDQGVGHALVAKTEKEFNAAMEKLMTEIHADMEVMIQGENAWWGKMKNPLRFHAEK